MSRSKPFGAGFKAGRPAAPDREHRDPSDPPACPDCGGDRLTYREPGGLELLVCVDCTRWEPTDEFDHLGA